MTIIAANAHFMACDTQGTGAVVGQSYGSKITRVEQRGDLPDLLIGCVNDFNVMRWARGLKDTEVSDLPSAERLWDTYQDTSKERGQRKDGDARGMALLLTGGVVYQAEHSGNVLVPSRGWTAAGSGWEVALGALHAGAHPADAVRAAIQFNIYCGGECVVEPA